MMAVAVLVMSEMPGVLTLEPMHAMTTSTSFRHCCSTAVLSGVPSKKLIWNVVVMSMFGNCSSSLARDRTKILSVMSSLGCEKRQRRMARPVEPVAPRRAYVGIVCSQVFGQDIVSGCGHRSHLSLREDKPTLSNAYLVHIV